MCGCSFGDLSGRAVAPGLRFLNSLINLWGGKKRGGKVPRSAVGWSEPGGASPRLTVIDRKVSTTSLVEYTYM